MKKNFKRILAVLLTLIMTFSCFGIVSQAATAKTVIQYGKAGGYLAIGDSLSRGCGTDGFYMDRDKAPDGGQYDLYEMRNVEGAIPYQIAQAVGCKAPVDITDQDATYWPCVYPGMTTAVAMDLLGIEDNFKDVDLNYPYYDSVLKYFGYEGSFDGVREKDVYVEGECGLCGNIVDLVKKADLITLELGMCDVFYRAYKIATKSTLSGGFSFDKLDNPEAIINLVKTALKEIYVGYNYWKEYFPVLLKTIKEMNPDATIVVVGAFNIVNQVPITDDMILPFGSIVNPLTDSMNRLYKKWAKEYDVLYADVSNTESQSTENDWSLLGDFMHNTFTGTHPTQQGYDYMVRQILSVLPEANKTDAISLDLGRFNKVDYVLVNGIPTTDFEMDGYQLTVNYTGSLAQNLTVGIVNEDGTLAVQTYRLAYKAGGGYDAYRIIGKNDLLGTVIKPFKLIKSLIEKLVAAIQK
ncbi:MAG: GDSL-type esterase/lipase family protein [Clostridia bacterium]|nr:GDSL-type esterase/lipase family protein [Clostridia bacterium]